MGIISQNLVTCNNFGRETCFEIDQLFLYLKWVLFLFLCLPLIFYCYRLSSKFLVSQLCRWFTCWLAGWPSLCMFALHFCHLSPHSVQKNLHFFVLIHVGEIGWESNLSFCVKQFTGGIEGHMIASYNLLKTKIKS